MVADICNPTNQGYTYKKKIIYFKENKTTIFCETD